MAHWTLDETSSPCADSSGNAIPGTWGGTPTSSMDGYLAGAMEFDGVSDYISTNYNGVLGNRDRTVSAWIKAIPDNSLILRTIVAWGGTAIGGSWNLAVNYVSGEGPSGTIRIAANSSKVIGTTPVDDNRWHHVAVVFANDGTPTVSDIQLYIDGKREVLSYSVDATLNTGTGYNVNIGAMRYQTNDPIFFFKGKIDDVRIYDRALSDADLWQMYQASVGGGIRGYGSLAQISECIITQNKSIVDGGGFSNSNVNMDSCKIVKNISDAKGGGLYCRSGVVTNCIFSENHANTPYYEYAYGGGMHIDWSLTGVLIKDTYFIDNETMGHGGAVSTYCPVDIVNCVFYANKTTVGGGGAIAFWNSVNINSCTFTRNESQAGTIRNSSLYNSQIRNSILYGNLGGYVIYDPISSAYQSNLDISYSVIEGGLNGFYCFGRLLTGSNNLSNNPSFLGIFSPAGPDGEFKTFDDGLCLNDSSPCIDASDDTVISAEKDITGDIRKYDDPVVANTGSGSSMADIGAYECGFRAVPDVVNLTQAQAQTQLQSVGLNVGTTFPSYSLTIPVGSVYSQNPAANSRVFKGASIAIGVVTAQAFLPAIPDGATDVGTDIVLQWLKGVGASSHLVYFGTDRDAIASAIDPNAVTTDTIYSPGQLQANTTYYWRVDEVNSFGTATGTVWSFTTGNPEVIYVNVSVEGGLGDGTSWANAFQNLQSAMDKAMPCDQIWVAGGVYSPTKQVDEEDSRSASFIPRGGVQVYGGFAGTESSLDQRIPGQNQTLLSGDIGLVGDDDDNCYHVFYYTGNNWGEIYLEGLSIVNGNASMPRGGGAVYLNASQCSIKLDHCLVYNNQGYATGAILCYGNAVIESSEFYDNISGEGNTNSFGGAAQFIGIRNTDIVQVRNCRFYANSAGQGGALYSSVDLVLVNSIFSNNYAEEAGGALLAYEGTVNITNCSMTGNQSSLGGGLYNRTATSILYNNIFWTNTADAYGEIYNYGGIVSAGYCDIENGYNGNKCFGVTNLGGNIQVYPGFDCSGVLALTSPCLDAGAPNAPFIAQTDFHGNSRMMDSNGDGNAVTDIGPNEYYSQRIIYVDVNNQTGDNNGSNWDHAYRDLQDAFDHAKWGDTIYIATGIYTPTHPLSEYESWAENSQYFGGNCFYLPTDGIVIYGGKVPYGNESETEQTVISGDIGIQGDISDNCETLLYIPNNGKRDYVLIENLVFSDAVGDAVWSSRQLPQDTKAEERNVICFSRCYFTQNHPYQNQDNSFSSVVYLSAYYPYDFMKCKFSQNKTERLLECSSGSTQSVRLNSCRFVNNKYNGSHSYNIFDVSALRIENCVFKNTGMTICISELLEDVSTVLTNNVFMQSPLFISGYPKYKIDKEDDEDEIIYKEYLYEEERRPIITNCTFLNSSIQYRSISPIVTNTILWPGSIYLFPGSQEPVIPLQATYCIVPDIYAATTINTTPDIQGMFCTRSGQDMGQYNAPEIYSWGILSYYTRGTTPDIGAYEYDPSKSYPPASNSMECDWQYTYHYKSYGSTGVSPTIDYDGDGLNNYHEYLNKTDPWSKDTDADGMDDKWEVDNGLNPDLDDSASDKDGDGMINSYEYQYRKELYGATGLDVTTPDETLNLDGDEFVNLIEYHYGYDPTQTTSQTLAVDFKYDSYGTRYCVSMVNGMDLEYWVNKPVDTVTIKIKNTTDNDWNAAIKTITLVNQPAGKNIVEWNGRNNNNNLVNQGYYDIQIMAVSDTEESVWDSSVLSRKENRCQFMYPPAIGVDKYFNIYKNQTSSITCAYNEIYGIGGLAMNIVDMNNNNAIVKQLYSGPVFYGDKFEWDGRKDDGTIFNGEFNVQIGGAFTLLPIGPILIKYIDAQPLANVHCNPYRIALVYGEVTNIGFNLDYPADITVKIYSPTDNTNPVKVFECGPLLEGYYSDLMWDGKDSNGQYAAEGIYRVEVTADFITFEQIINGTVTVYH